MSVFIPDAYDLVEVRGFYAAFNGASLNGTVTFVPSIPYTTIPDAKLVVITRPIEGKVVDGVLLNSKGSGPLQLFATDDPDAGTSGWTYQTTENLGPSTGRKPYNITVPIAAKSSGLDLWQLATAAPVSNPGETYVLLPAFVSLQDRVTWLEANGTGTPAAGGGITLEQAADAAPVQSVAGRQGNVTLSRADVGLALVNNTPDLEKPLSAAMQNALSTKAASAAGVTTEERAKLNGLPQPTTVGAALVGAVDAYAARQAIAAGTSSLTLGTTPGTAKAGDYAPPAATASVQGVVELATPEEVTTGTDTTRAATPAGVKTAIDLTAAPMTSYTPSASRPSYYPVGYSYMVLASADALNVDGWPSGYGTVSTLRASNWRAFQVVVENGAVGRWIRAAVADDVWGEWRTDGAGPELVAGANVALTPGDGTLIISVAGGGGGSVDVYCIGGVWSLKDYATGAFTPITTREYEYLRYYWIQTTPGDPDAPEDLVRDYDSMRELQA